jgi:hypothetical protein
LARKTLLQRNNRDEKENSAIGQGSVRTQIPRMSKPSARNAMNWPSLIVGERHLRVGKAMSRAAIQRPREK